MPSDLSQLTDEQLQVYKDLLAKKQGTPEKPPEQSSAISRFGTGLYNTTIGPVAQAVQHPIDTASNLAGVPQLQEAWNQAKQGQYAPAAMSLAKAADLPGRMASGAAEPIAQDVQQGNYAGAAGQMTGLGASLAAGKIPSTRLGSAVGAGARAAGPDIATGGALIGGGELLGKVPGMEWPARIGMGYPGARAVAEGLKKGSRAFGEAWKGPVKPPGPEPPPIPTKGPSIGDLKSAAVNGTITPEAFDAAIDKMTDLTFDKKTLAKADLRSSLQKVNPPNMGQPQKPLSLGSIKESVKAGDNDIDWFRDKLKQQGHSDEGIELESKRLTREIKEEKAAKEETKAAKETKNSSETKVKPKNQTKAPEVKTEPVKTETPKNDHAVAHEAYVDALKAGAKPEEAEKVYRNVLDNSDTGKAAFDNYDKNTIAGKMNSGEINLDNLPKGGKKVNYDKLGKELGKVNSPESTIDEATRGGPGTPSATAEVKPPSETSKTQGPKVEAPKKLAPEVEPRYEPYYDPDNPLKRAPISQAQIEESQSIARAAKETRLARHLVENKIDLDNIPKTPEYRKSLGNDAGLKIERSERTLEGAINRARELKKIPEKQ
jgi:hypothetical protein